MATCFTVLTGLSWEGAAFDLLSQWVAIIFLCALSAVGVFAGYKFQAGSAFYLPVIVVISTLLLLMLLIYRMEIQFLIGGHQCIGDYRKPGDWSPPRVLYWHTEMLKVAIVSVSSVLIPFWAGRYFRSGRKFGNDRTEVIQ